MKKETKEKLSRSRNSSHKSIIVLITAITTVAILLAGIGFLTTIEQSIEQLKSENVKLINKNTELMNEM